MKNAFKTIVLLSIAILTPVCNAAIETMYSAKGYPYKDLIERAEEVKIIYSENANSVTCKVAITSTADHWLSDSKTISHKTFAEAPLASCLSREDAKAQLANTYAS